MKDKILTLFYSGISTFSNLIASLIVFIILARVLDKALFGDYLFYNSLAAIVSVLIDFGINQKLLREGRLDITKLNILFLDNLILKTCIFLVVFVIYFIFLIPVLRYDFYSILIFLTVSSFSFFQMSTVIFRVVEDYKLEALFTFISSVIFILACLICLYYTSNIYLICLTLLSVRLSTFIVSLMIIKKRINLRYIKKVVFFKKLIIESIPYFTDGIVSVLYSNVDTLIIKYIIGPVGVATYNSGLKLASGSLGISTILSNIYLPKISLLIYNSNEANKNEAKVFQELLGLLASIGLLLVLIFTYFNTLMSQIVFNNKFEGLIILLPFFGLFVCSRLLASYYGIILTAIGKQKARAKANLIAFIAMIFSGIIFTFYFGLKGTLFSLIITTILLILFYVFILRENQFKHLYLKSVFGILILTIFIVWTRLSY